MISFVFYSLSSPTVAFNSVFARIWQFLIGMIVYLLRNMEAPKPSYEKLELGESDEKVKLLEEGVTGEVFESSVQKRIPVKLISHLLPSLLILITAFPFNLTSVVTRSVIFTLFLTVYRNFQTNCHNCHWNIDAYF
uniref:Pecanex-like protein n=1 Tax=Caenorhabditis tropicalis TaxID=1561998 RepID=A0A1I7U2Y9_9PELO